MKIFLIIIGCLSLALGTIGTFLPILPTVPFYLLAAFCFLKSSKKLHDWFTKTKLYQKNLESFINGKGMTKKTKIKILGSVTVLMGIGFFCMKKVPVGQIILAVVWAFHVIYFIFGIKTLKEEKKEIYNEKQEKEKTKKSPATKIGKVAEVNSGK